MAVPVASVALLWQVLFDRHGLLNGWIVSLGGLPARLDAGHAGLLGAGWQLYLEKPRL